MKGRDSNGSPVNLSNERLLCEMMGLLNEIRERNYTTVASHLKLAVREFQKDLQKEKEVYHKENIDRMKNGFV